MSKKSMKANKLIEKARESFQQAASLVDLANKALEEDIKEDTIRIDQTNDTIDRLYHKSQTLETERSLKSKKIAENEKLKQRFLSAAE
jgi:nitrate/nitrite-specific signal transduction histidine kinase